MAEIARARADPSKAFFVRMLTRDIALDDCILDLIDNSVDGAWKHSGVSPAMLEEDDSLRPYQIDLTLNSSEFRIRDNCGGITLDDAVDYAFTFGRLEDAPEEHGYSVGVYGIGMKRAVFKMGTEVSIRSTYEAAEGAESFEVPINVLDWLADQNTPWDFALEEAPDLAENGVEIVVTELYPEIARRLVDQAYVRRLRRIIERDYMIPLQRGLVITINGEHVQGWKITYSSSDDFVPMRRSYDDGPVRVEILAGMAATPPDDVNPDDSRTPDLWGWYVVCNGRVVLAGDKTETTGWGSTFQKWHRQYDGFIGLAIFSSEDPESLPMTTTKRSVDVSSDIYLRAVGQFSAPTKAWIAYTHARKQNIPAAKPLETATTARPISQVAQSAVVSLPALGRDPNQPEMANVNYAVELEALRKLASALGDINLSYRDVGLGSFDYTYRHLVGRD